MIIVIQRVKKAQVKINAKLHSSIKNGLVVLLGIHADDTQKEAEYLCKKVANLRIFSDNKGKMNFSCLDVRGDILVVSQFTLAGDCSRGRRPGFERAADPITARTLYEYYVELLTRSDLKIGAGRFSADMKVQLVNDGPVTFLLER